MKSLWSAASVAAICIAVNAGPIYAQESEENTSTLETIVVTGSAIRGTPEDAALPVEVFSAEDLALEGSPTGLEFAKDLTISGPTSGEANYFGGGNLTGSPAFNLRSLGAEKTLTLLNGRRMSQNLSNIPSIAIARTEVLKDGAATIYGADAVGGVVNFITKEDFVGVEVEADYEYVDGSDGDWSMGILAGFGEDDTNFIIGAEWEHRSRLDTQERDFSSLPYWENPGPWSNLTNLANYTPIAAFDTESPTGSNLYLASPLTGYYSDFTQETCETQGGIFQPNQALGPRCAYGYLPYYNLVEDQDIYRVFAQLDTTINEYMDFHIDATYGQVLVPEQFASPSLPTTRGPATGLGASLQYWVPRSNPYVSEFEARSGAGGYAAFVAANPALFGGAAVNGYAISLLRPFAHNGNPVGGRGEGFGNAASIDNQIWRVSAGLDGILPEEWTGALGEIGYDFGVTYNQSITEYTDPDYLGFRLQEALNGFGGPNCNVQDLNPDALGTQNPAAAGTGNCMWFNPFASAYASQPELGLVNPSYVAGSENPDELVSWLFDPRLSETITSNLTFDFVVDGMTPVELPGGNIGWAVGTQWRLDEFREFNPSPFYNGATPCPYPNGQDLGPQNTSSPYYTGCYGQGPFGFYGTDEADYYDRQSFSFFAETNIPVLDTLNFQLAVRNEQFSGDLSSTVYKVAGKWDVFGPLSVRGSYSTNFTAPPITLQQGSVQTVNRSYTVLSGAWLAAETFTLEDIEPEEAESFNIGAIWQSEGISPDHDFQLIVDYFNIETTGEIDELATPNDIASAVFSSSDDIETCDHPLIGRVTLNDTGTSPGGNCTASTVASDLNIIRTDIGNGTDQLTSGVDFQVNYDFPVGGADMRIGVTGTKLLELESSAQILDGFTVKEADDRLGYLNFSSVGFAAPDLRINAFVNYNRDQHNVRLTARYVSAIEDERTTTITEIVDGETVTSVVRGVDPLGVFPGTSDEIGLITKGVDIDSSLTFDATYVYDFSENLLFTATIDNILDEDPPYTRTEFGYDPRIADPLGRTIKVGVKASF